jgi:hypothetical protein
MKRYGGKRSFFLHHADMHQPIIPIMVGFFPISPALHRRYSGTPGQTGKKEVKKSILT